MKDRHELGQEAFGNFIRAHPELAVASNDPMGNLLISQNRVYSRIAIDFAVQFIMDEIALKGKDMKIEDPLEKNQKGS